MRRRLISEIWKLLETKTCQGGGKRGREEKEGGGRREIIDGMNMVLTLCCKVESLVIP